MTDDFARRTGQGVPIDNGNRDEAFYIHNTKRSTWARWLDEANVGPPPDVEFTATYETESGRIREFSRTDSVRYVEHIAKMVHESADHLRTEDHAVVCDIWWPAMATDDLMTHCAGANGQPCTVRLTMVPKG